MVDLVVPLLKTQRLQNCWWHNFMMGYYGWTLQLNLAARELIFKYHIEQT